MLKLKVFKTTEEDQINEFLNQDDVLLAPGYPQVHGDTIAILHHDSIPAYDEQSEKDALYRELYEQKATLTRRKLDLALLEGKAVDENYGIKKRELEKHKDITEKSIAIVEAMINA